MFLTKQFDDPTLNLTCEVFLRELVETLGSRLISVLLYGSVVHGDLAPGFGDLDFVGVLDGDLSEADCAALTAVRRPLRSGAYGTLAAMLEGAFLPRPMLRPDVDGAGFWWGTTRERAITRNRLGCFNAMDMRDYGETIFGIDVRQDLPVPGRSEMLREAVTACSAIRDNACGGQWYSVDWLLQLARLLAYARCDRMLSKTAAADWARVHASGSWRMQLADAARWRLEPAYRERPGASDWLSGLAVPIIEGCAEVAAALTEAGDVDNG